MTQFRKIPSLVAIPVSQQFAFSDEGPLLETLEFFAISHNSYQPSNFLSRKGGRVRARERGKEEREEEIQKEKQTKKDFTFTVT